MQFIGFLLFYIFAIPFSLLPMPVLYVFSDALYLVIYKIVGYRKAVVKMNLRNSFPQKSEAELLQIEKDYYHNMCDWVLETIKLFTMSEKEFRKRMTFPDEFLYEKLFKQNRHLMIAGAHFNNFEWGAQRFNLSKTYQLHGLYTPMSNKYMDRFIKKNRSRFGAKIIAAKDIKDVMAKPLPALSSFGFIADQSPRRGAKVYWTTFLNQDTACFTGVERYAIQLNAPVVFGFPMKIKRGYYRLHLELISDEPQLAFPYTITEAQNRFLEKIITENPSAWMWSHKRWKLKKNAE